MVVGQNDARNVGPVHDPDNTVRIDIDQCGEQYLVVPLGLQWHSNEADHPLSREEKRGRSIG